MAINFTFNLPKIMKYGSLFCGIAIMFAGLSVTLNVLNAFHVPTFVLAISQILFGLLIAQTVKVRGWSPQGMCGGDETRGEKTTRGRALRRLLGGVRGGKSTKCLSEIPPAMS